MQIVEGLAARQDHAREGGAAVVGDLDLAPNADLIFVQEFADGPTVTLKAVGTLTDGNAHFTTSEFNLSRMNAATSLAGALFFSMRTALPIRNCTSRRHALSLP